MRRPRDFPALVSALVVAGALGAAPACSAALQGRATEERPGQAPPALAGPQAPALPALERARVGYAFDSAALLRGEWPWFSHLEVCVLLVAPEAQWVLNCDTCPQRFETLGERFRGRPVCALESDTVTTTGTPLPSRDLLALLAATAVVPHAQSPHTELTGSQPWVIVSSLDALSAFHPAFGPETSTEEWVSVFLHEFFHTEQLSSAAFAADLANVVTRRWDQDALLELFERSLHYRRLVVAEYTQLSRAAALDDRLTPAAARATLARWSQQYAKRKASLSRLPKDGETLRRADSVFTYLEGVARYVESRFLVADSHAPAKALVIDDRFHAFQPPRPPGYSGLPQTPLGKRYYYAIGMHLALLLDRADPSWKQRVHDHPDWLIGLARDAGKAQPVPREATSTHSER